MDIFRSASPFVLCNVLVLILISLWEPFTMWLPGLLGFS